MTARPPNLADYVAPAELDHLIQLACREDLGPSLRDLTSQLLIEPSRRSSAVLRARHPGRLAGAALLPAIVAAYDPKISLTTFCRDGDDLAADEDIATFHGSLRGILALERIALNFLTHLCGIATLTARFVAAVADTSARICDTRKTLPGLRALQKYAVACGGGVNHRMGLFDAVLVKDNHIAHIPLADLSAAIGQLVQSARTAFPPPKFIQVEVDNLDQLRRVLTAGLDRVLLDNMPPEVLREAVKMRDDTAPKVLLEASGGISLANVRAIASSGVDLISIGSLTHSAPALDLGLDIAGKQGVGS
ncbi:MAG: carboxylating nicotinate-nucleotide diphosphorylase [Phycisphaeraceae bacterium]|nr:carboxylating nicotinate-nucleotide diphosphorylase [Phycisphaeraceae bacterium]